MLPDYMLWAAGTQAANPYSVAKYASNKRDRDGEVIAWLTAYVNSPVDGFTATRCAECGRTDGAHDPQCSQHPDYVAPKLGKSKSKAKAAR